MTGIAVLPAAAVALALFGYAAVAGQGPANPAQSTRLIAYSVTHPMPGAGETEHLCLVDPQTGRTRRLTHKRYVADIHPAWSPDGQTLAFTRGFYLDTQGANVFAVDANGRSSAESRGTLVTTRRPGLRTARDWPSHTATTALH